MDRAIFMKYAQLSTFMDLTPGLLSNLEVQEKVILAGELKVLEGTHGTEPMGLRRREVG